jgi:hypothetical protein
MQDCPLLRGLCCKSRKLQGSRFFAKTLSSERALIRMTSIALRKSPVNFARGREVPHILYTKVAPTARRILVIGENRLLQHNRPIADARGLLLRSPFKQPVADLLRYEAFRPLPCLVIVTAELEVLSEHDALGCRIDGSNPHHLHQRA